MKKRDDQLEETLSAIRREYRQIAAPQSIKALLMREVGTGVKRANPARRLWLKPLLLGPAFLLLCGICAAAFFLTRHAIPIPESPISTVSRPQPQQDSVRGDSSIHPLEKRTSRRQVRSIPPVPAQESNAGEFVALPSSEGLPAPMVATVVRMRIRSESLREFGLDVSPVTAPETVLAEFVVGEDGLSRAVRFIR